MYEWRREELSKFVIECPNCGKFAEAKMGFFARKKLTALVDIPFMFVQTN